jgi:transaldolase
MGNIATLQDLGCSVYHDGMSRSLIRSGAVDRLIRLGVSGVTTNPVIFHQAISSGADYEEQITSDARSGQPSYAVMWDVIVEDVRLAADMFEPVYRKANGADGYVSVEVDPALADDADGTLAAARRLWSRIDRPNVMIKVPATEAGISCVEPLTFDGINVNVTVVATIEAFESVFRAHARGLARRIEAGARPDVVSVASLFLSRIDSVVDQAIDELATKLTGETEALAALKGKAGLATAKLAYRRFHELRLDNEHHRLWQAGGKPQRLLWASTAPRNPSYPKLMYVEGLIGPDTVITLPPVTLEEFEDRGAARAGTLTEGADEAAMLWDRLNALGITAETVKAGVHSIVLPLFAQAMQQLEALVDERCKVRLSPI